MDKIESMGAILTHSNDQWQALFLTVALQVRSAWQLLATPPVSLLLCHQL